MGLRLRLFRRWRDKCLAEFHDRLRDKVRSVTGRDPEPTAGIIDAQSVKAAASVPAVTRSFDGGKKVNGRKRPIVVDTLGLLLAVMATAASVTDRDWPIPARGEQSTLSMFGGGSRGGQPDKRTDDGRLIVKPASRRRRGSLSPTVGSAYGPGPAGPAFPGERRGRYGQDAAGATASRPREATSWALPSARR